MEQVAFLAASLAESVIEAVSGVQTEAAIASLAETEPATAVAVVIGIASGVEPLAVTLK